MQKNKVAPAISRTTTRHTTRRTGPAGPAVQADVSAYFKWFLASKPSNDPVAWVELTADDQPLSDFTAVEMARYGVKKASVDILAEHLGINKKKLAEDILSLSVKTIERKAPADKMDKQTSSHVIEIARVIRHANHVFEDESKLKLWLNTDNRSLAGRKPSALLDTLTGINLVNDTLTRIEEGVYS